MKCEETSVRSRDSVPQSEYSYGRAAETKFCNYLLLRDEFQNNTDLENFFFR